MSSPYSLRPTPVSVAEIECIEVPCPVLSDGVRCSFSPPGLEWVDYRGVWCGGGGGGEAAAVAEGRVAAAAGRLGERVVVEAGGGCPLMPLEVDENHIQKSLEILSYASES